MDSYSVVPDDLRRAADVVAELGAEIKERAVLRYQADPRETGHQLLGPALARFQDLLGAAVTAVVEENRESELALRATAANYEHVDAGQAEALRALLPRTD